MPITLTLAWRNLWRHPRRTALSAVVVAFAAALLIFFVTLQFGAYDMMMDNAVRLYGGAVQVQRPGYQARPQIRNTIPAAGALARRLRAGLPGVAVSQRAQGFALAASVTRSYGVQVVGVEPEHEPQVSTLPGLTTVGRYLSPGDTPHAVLGARLARNLQVAPGSELTLLGSARDGSVAATVVTVVGVFRTGVPELDRYVVEIPLRHFQEVYIMPDQAHRLVLGGVPASRAPALARRVAALLPPDSDLAVLDWAALNPGVRQAIDFDMLQGWVYYLALILIVGFSILNTFLMAVLERTREFGLMLALGATPWRIGAQLWLESCLLTGLGLAAGTVLGLAVALWLRVRGFTYPGLEELGAQFGLSGRITPKIAWWTILLGPAAVWACVMLGALYPLPRLRRLRPVAALQAL